MQVWKVVVMSKVSANTVGFFVASAIPAALFSIFTPLAGKLGIGFLIDFIVYYPFSVAATVLFGLPAFLLLRRLRLVTWWTTLAGGYAVGTLMAIILGLPNRPETRDFVMFGSVGLVSGFVFWMISRCGRDSAR
jgi:hypothetical protein